MDETLLKMVGWGCLVIGGMFMGDFSLPNKKDKATVFQEKGKPNILRTYESSRRDDIYVEDSNNNYISFRQYLKNIPNKYDKQIEKARIKKLVKW